MMREICFCLLILCFQSIFVNAQSISNLNAVQVGQQLHIHYSLISGSACEVQLRVSTDNGKKWSTPLTKVTGDVGKNIAAGEKQIIWNVLEEREQLVGDKICFKVSLNTKKNKSECIEVSCKGSNDLEKKLNGMSEIVKQLVLKKEDLNSEQTDSIIRVVSDELIGGVRFKSVTDAYTTSSVIDNVQVEVTHTSSILRIYLPSSLLEGERVIDFYTNKIQEGNSIKTDVVITRNKIEIYRVENNKVVVNNSEKIQELQLCLNDTFKKANIEFYYNPKTKDTILKYCFNSSKH